MEKRGNEGSDPLRKFPDGPMSDGTDGGGRDLRSPAPTFIGRCLHNDRYSIRRTSARLQCLAKPIRRSQSNDATYSWSMVGCCL